MNRLLDLVRMSRSRATLAICSTTHLIHDGFSEVLYVLFPIWATEFRLSFAQVGLLKAAYSGGTAAFQIPAGVLAERWGEKRLLGAGTVMVAFGFLILGTVHGFGFLFVMLLLAGLSSGVQHPLSSSVVSNAYETGARWSALGIYNFSGDLGKVTVPTLVAFATASFSWRWATGGYGLVGFVAAVGILIALTRLEARDVVPRESTAESEERANEWGIRDSREFQTLAAIGIIDHSTRSAFLTLLPFLLIAKGATVGTVGVALTLTFTGGAMGKFACSVLAGRVGAIRTVLITVVVTSVGLLLLLPLPLTSCLLVLPLLGIGLNGTSSVVYSSVADLVMPERRSRAYGLLYTLGIGTGAGAPFLYGLLSDWVGVPVTIAVLSLVALTTIPLSWRLRVPMDGEPAYSNGRIRR